MFKATVTYVQHNEDGSAEVKKKELTMYHIPSRIVSLMEIYGEENIKEINIRKEKE